LSVVKYLQSFEVHINIPLFSSSGSKFGLIMATTCSLFSS